MESIFFRGVGTATPTARYTKAECLDARSHLIARTVLQRDNGIETRSLAVDVPDGWWWLSSFGAGFSCHGATLKVH